ncbi:L-threonate dehydrogenase [Oceanisphaera psychrotolerans]|uniref:L-threonate dehydrogenase n=1 Tax=Oceanisphaera psychrotolerans TaxID=1414654 RepID=A0A1J4QAV3_9GAMM|nr:L-threonate dehydrogenase [Oceanisphaera psychrotolerans]OIN05552.1 oxidoreductase [Oceanisphaera psychrotolerans]
MSMISRVGVVGLGSMGMGTAMSLVRAGFDTYGFDLNAEACARLAEAGAVASGPSALPYAGQLDALLLLVVNGAQVESVLFGENGVAEAMRPGSLVVVCSTMAATQTKAIHQRLTEMGLEMIDAPISGGAVKAAEGRLSVMASGKPALFEQAKALFDAIAEKLYVIGPDIGQGSTVKTIHQLLAGVHIAAAAEAMAMAAKADIPLELMFDVVTHSAGNSWMFENRVPHILEGDYSPRSSVDIFVKDLGIVLDSAHQMKFPLPLASAAHQMFLAASNEGFGREDDAAVVKIFKGIQLPEEK